MFNKTNASGSATPIRSTPPSGAQTPQARSTGASTSGSLRHESLTSRRGPSQSQPQTMSPRQPLASQEGDSLSLLSSPTRSESFNTPPVGLDIRWDASGPVTPNASSFRGGAAMAGASLANASFFTMGELPERDELVDIPLERFMRNSRRQDMPHLAEHEEPAVPEPQSWNAMLRQLGIGAMETGGAAMHRLGEVATAARTAVAESTTVQAVGSMLPSQRIMGAALGHGIHQAASVFGPTFLREMMAESMKVAFRTASPSMVLGMQLGVGLLNIGMAVMREQRESRDPDTAARGFHAMTAEQWAACSDGQQEALRQTQQRMSRLVTLEQIGASMASVGLSLYGTLTGNEGMAADVLAVDIKTLAYSFARDFIQASFSMVGTEGETSGGVSGSHLNSASLFYGLANVVGNEAWSELPILGGDTAAARAVLLDGASSSNARSAAWGEIAGASAIKAAINWAVETADWISVTQQEALQSDTVQQWSPRLTGTDYGRLLDQTPARITAITAGNAVYNVLGNVNRGGTPGQQDFVSNTLAGLLAGLQYAAIGGSWQAEGAVRQARREAEAEVRNEDRSAPQGGLRQRRPHPSGNAQV
ncbi:hypothetical protein [Paracidovorax valerianellae]|uniref:Uncharacterized protein n=1 Tax=Paracidovorax valerianellae TaxID=187868 RepID=A0A1G6SD38_9BURK|nr:hypothetical protein [Paracidovorax valerianellae]MDA8444240.1 hypothetical protein [Paracidovorax valerianellae]SDD14067.1 hypothetical protein SAMN05192589_104393 [Paracidovorax valerianellae]